MIANPPYPYGTDFREVKLLLRKEDCDFLENTYGKNWIKRIEQHITNEIRMRRHDEEALGVTKKWDY